ncbi:hypothetical protein LOCC1_G005345, partial [Lachnellula occidentalis]
LEDQAALAALYVTNHNSSNDGHRYLDGDQKLSSAGAAASLKYAQPKDLPSYPTAGLKDHDSAAGAAASLGWANQKPFEHWKPDPSASASAAAMLAKDYKMAPLWQPEASANGAKAAVLAHKDGGKVEIWQPEVNAWGGSAAAQAFKKYGAGTLSPQLNYGYTALGRQGSLMAATGAMASGRKRAESNPAPIVKTDTYPDESRAASNALSAATSSMRKKRTTNHVEGGSVPYTNMGREMYTSHPPVAPEVEEQNRNNVLRASAVAMAKQMYNYQQTHIDAAADAQRGAVAAHGRHDSVSTTGEEAQPMSFVNLQEAAQRLAHERLAKLHDEHSKNREYRDYYSSEAGAASKPSYAPASKMTIRGRQRRRASSTGTADSDQEQSNRIRAQMSTFSSNLSQVDTKKRQHDREALIAAAQRNVTKSLHGMDEKVFAETGKIGPSLLSEWEVKAHAAAQAKSDSRMENYGKVNIGGGKFVNQSAIDLVAQKNVQPVLDEINEKAEQERVRQAEIKMEQDTQRRKDAEKKTQEKEKKDINKQLKQKDKEERKGRGAEEKRRSQKADAIPATTTRTSDEGAYATPASPEPVGAKPVGPTPLRTSMEDQASVRIRDAASAANKDEPTPINTSPTSPKDDGKVKNWLKTRFSRRQSRTQKSSPEESEPNNRSSFVGGAALTGASANDSTVSLGQKSTGVTSPLASPAVKDENPEDERVGRAVKRKDSEVSSELSEAEFQEARDEFDEDLAPPRTFVAAKSSSPARETKFVEAI